MSEKRMKCSTVALLGASIALGACDNAVGVGGAGEVALSFRVASGAGAAPASVAAEGGAPSGVAGPPLVLVGSNGTLTLDEILLIVNEVELKREGPGCDSTEVEGWDCGEFEAPPRFLDLPLDGQPIAAVTAMIPPGTYDELDFEIEDLEDDADSPEEAAAIAAVRAVVLAQVPDWPRKASAMVSGSFAPTAGGSVDFRVFLEAEVEIEMELVPDLVVDESGSANRELTVTIDPGQWFGNPDGSVVPLHLYDWDLTGDLLEFEVEMEHGFTEVEIED